MNRDDYKTTRACIYSDFAYIELAFVGLVVHTGTRVTKKSSALVLVTTAYRRTH